MRDIGRWSGGAAVAASVLVMNIATYAYSVVAARLLGPTAFGELAAVMGVLIIANVLALGLQAMAARRVSRAVAAPTEGAPTEETGAAIHAVALATRWTALSSLLVMLVLAPVGHAVLDLTSWTTSVSVAVSVSLLTLIGGQAGVLQGTRQWGRLTAQQVTFAVGRLGVGWVALLLYPSTAAATAAVAVGLLPVALVGGRAFRVAGPRAAPEGGALREALHDAHTLLAFFAFANLDAIVLRAAVDEHRAGLVAGGLILTKAALFLPQFVLVVAFPGMATATSRGPLARVLGAVAVLGTGATLGVLALPGLALQFIGGSRYGEVAGSLWLFTLLGTALALLQVVVYGELAGHGRRLAPLLWLGVAATVVLAVFPDLADDYLSWRTVGAALALVVALALVLSAPRRAKSGPRPR